MSKSHIAPGSALRRLDVPSGRLGPAQYDIEPARSGTMSHRLVRAASDLDRRLYGQTAGAAYRGTFGTLPYKTLKSPLSPNPPR